MSKTLTEQLAERLEARAESQGERVAQGDDEAREDFDAEPESEPRESESVDDEGQDESPQEDGASEKPAKSSGRYTPEALAKAIGWETSDLFESLEIPVDDGESLTLGQLKDKRHETARIAKELEQQRQALANEWVRFQQQRAQSFGESQQQSQAMREAKSRMDAIKAQHGLINWEQLSAGDRADLRQRLAIEYADASQQFEGAKLQAEEANRLAFAQMQAEHRVKLFDLVPKWKENPEVARQEAEQTARFLIEKMGFHPEELATIHHGPAQAVAYYAWKYFQQEAAINEAKEKVRSAPKKVLRPGGAKSPVRLDAQVKTLTERAKRTHTRADKTAAAKAVLARGLSRKRQ